jgi:hypothetical protein
MNPDIFALFIGLVAVVAASLAVLIPIVRLSFGSWIDRTLSLLEARQNGGSEPASEVIRQMEQRLSLIEHQLEANQQQLQHSAERNAFYERLLEPQLRASGAENGPGSRG